MKPIDLTKILKKYNTGWVAITSNYNKAVASAQTLKQLDNKLKKLNNPKVVLIPAAQNYRGFIT